MMDKQIKKKCEAIDVIMNNTRNIMYWVFMLKTMSHLLAPIFVQQQQRQKSKFCNWDGIVLRRSFRKWSAKIRKLLREENKPRNHRKKTENIIIKREWIIGLVVCFVVKFYTFNNSIHRELGWCWFLSNACMFRMSGDRVMCCDALIFRCHREKYFFHRRFYRRFCFFFCFLF